MVSTVLLFYYIIYIHTTTTHIYLLYSLSMLRRFYLSMDISMDTTHTHTHTHIYIYMYTHTIQHTHSASFMYIVNYYSFIVHVSGLYFFVHQSNKRAEEISILLLKRRRELFQGPQYSPAIVYLIGLV